MDELKPWPAAVFRISELYKAGWSMNKITFDLMDKWFLTKTGRTAWGVGQVWVIVQRIKDMDVNQLRAHADNINMRNPKVDKNVESCR